MSIDTYYTLTIDAGAPSKADAASHVHSAKRSTANAGDVTLAFDHAKLVNKNVLRSAVTALLLLAAGGNELS